MKALYVLVSIASIALCSMVLCAALAGAAANTSNPPTADTKAAAMPMKAQAGGCQMCPMMAAGRKDMGKGIDMPPEMKQRCQMMMNAEMSKDDAACLLACKEELKLTPDQLTKLEQISKESRQAAAAILTPEQAKTLAAIPGQPASMCAMHAKMHETMPKMEGAAPKAADDKAKKEPEAAATEKK